MSTLSTAARSRARSARAALPTACRKIANEIYDDMISFASYAFNKSHAACYAYVAFQTAYLKCHYPHEFMAALLTSVLDNTSRSLSIRRSASAWASGQQPDINI